MSRSARSERRPRSDASPTAGFLNTDWNPRELPAGTVTRNVVLRTKDGAATTGSLYVSGRSDTVVCVTHPREFMASRRRKGAHTPIMTIRRTNADLRCFDLSLDPSDRKYGSLWGSDPYTSNYGSAGFARSC